MPASATAHSAHSGHLSHSPCFLPSFELTCVPSSATLLSSDSFAPGSSSSGSLTVSRQGSLQWGHSRNTAFCVVVRTSSSTNTFFLTVCAVSNPRWLAMGRWAVFRPDDVAFRFRRLAFLCVTLLGWFVLRPLRIEHKQTCRQASISIL